MVVRLPPAFRCPTPLGHTVPFREQNCGRNHLRLMSVEIDSARKRTRRNGAAHVKVVDCPDGTLLAAAIRPLGPSAAGKSPRARRFSSAFQIVQGRQRASVHVAACACSRTSLAFIRRQFGWSHAPSVQYAACASSWPTCGTPSVAVAVDGAISVVSAIPASWHGSVALLDVGGASSGFTGCSANGCLRTWRMAAWTASLPAIWHRRW